MNGYSIRMAETIRTADANLQGVQLGRLCLERDVPVTKIARALKVSRQTVYGWFCGAVTPRPHHAKLIEALLSTMRRDE